MKRKILFYLLPLLGLTLSGCDLFNNQPPKDDDTSEKEGSDTPEDKDKTVYDVVVNKKQGIVEKEEGFLHELTYEEQVIDIVGYDGTNGQVGSIMKKTYNGKAINGMIYNRSIMSYLDKLRVDFDGGDLKYIFTDFLMEDMDFDSKADNKLVSGEPVTCPEGKGYFVIYTQSTAPVTVNAVKIKFKDHSFNTKMIYTKDTERGSARSYGTAKAVTESFIELESRPTRYTNNYSGSEKNEGHANADSWYRFNGQYFTDSQELGTDFTFGMTIAGEYSRFFNEEKLFHYNVWPQFSYGNENDEPWVQTYIGNDNYDPLGGTANYSYQGRFYTNFDMYDENWNVNYANPFDWVPKYWTFGNPDQAKIADGSMTYREAYNETKLPFWFLKFHVYLNEEENFEPYVDISINGKLIYSTYIFDEYDTESRPSIHIHTMPMHLINYGNPDGTTSDEFKYTGTFTYPRLIED